MVEDVEHFCPELQIQAFGDSGVLGDREIRVHEGRSGDGIAAQGSWMAGAGNDRIGFTTWCGRSTAEGAGHRECRKWCCRARWNRRRAASRRSIERFTQNRVCEPV